MLKRNSVIQYLAGLMICLVFTNCGNHESNEPDVHTGIKGRFVNQTYLQQIPDSIAGNIQAYCYELNFINADSVAVNYGFESGTLLYKKVNDHYLLLNAIQGKDLPFILNTDSTITLMDSSWTKQNDAWIGKPLNSKFKKVADIKGQQWVFDQCLNELMIAGTYQLFRQGKPMGQRIIFNKDGTMSGLENYTSYAICYSGDCVGETETISDQVTFKTKTDAAITYAIKVGKDRTISFYTIGSALKDSDGNDMKGGRKIEGKVFELKKQ